LYSQRFEVGSIHPSWIGTGQRAVCKLAMNRISPLCITKSNISEAEDKR
jgi:hypothetical protein